MEAKVGIGAITSVGMAPMSLLISAEIKGLTVTIGSKADRVKNTSVMKLGRETLLSAISTKEERFAVFEVRKGSLRWDGRGRCAPEMQDHNEHKAYTKNTM